MMAKEFTPVGMFAGTAFAIAVQSSLPAQNLAEFIALARAKPGLMFGSAGQGTSSHLCMELMTSLAAIKLMHVPYKGSVGALVDMAGGQVHASCQALPAYPTYVKTGRVRMLAATTAKRSRFAPDLPLVADTLPGYELLGWYGLLAPLKTPPALIHKINTEATRIANLPDIQERLIAAGAESMPSTPREFGALLTRETSKWSKVLREANIRPE
jgi:tripartite-type tricarboxylate transporter receptor subunit TctC